MTTELIARGVCILAGRVLLCKNLKHGYYYLPGGHVEFGETAAAALAREFLEETGEEARIGPLALVHEHVFRQGPHLRHELNLVFHVELRTDRIISREKKIAFDWAAPQQVGELDVRPQTHQAWLLRGMAMAPIQWVSDAT